MSVRHRPRANRLAGLALGLVLVGCATPPAPVGGPVTGAGPAAGVPPAPDPGLRQGLIARASEEWAFFGRQTVVFAGEEESIPHVGAWEDEDGGYSDRVNAYWRAVGKPDLGGRDCQQPWSAAFVSWVMLAAGVPESQFTPAAAHWVYLAGTIDGAGEPGRFFVPRGIEDYSPSPGDLICASRGPSHATAAAGASAPALRGASVHCDLVVAKEGRILEAIGGNVRNSVSKTTLALDPDGRLKPVPRRPWFLILQNRL
jgi:hypothetical protein